MRCINKQEGTIRQVVIVKNKLISVFNLSVLLLTMNFVITLTVKVVSYFDNVVTKFMINNRTDT